MATSHVSLDEARVLMRDVQKVLGDAPLAKTVTVTHTEADLHAKARAWMMKQFGKPSACADKDKWHERYGMLVEFVHDLFDHDDAVTP